MAEQHGGSINTGEGGSQVSCRKKHLVFLKLKKGEQHNIGMRTDITQQKSNDNAETGISFFPPLLFWAASLWVE